MKFRVFYNKHKYVDCSDNAISSSRIVVANSADEAREIVRDMKKAGKMYIGMIHQAEEITESE